MQAILLAGGLGTRLRSVVSDRPKPMALIEGKPFMEYVTRELVRHGITDIVFAVGYKGTMVEEHFGDGAAFGFHAGYAYEETLLGTAGAIKNAGRFITEDRFYVLNADTFYQIDYTRLLRQQDSQNLDMALVLRRVPDVSRYGQAILDRDGFAQSLQFRLQGVNIPPQMVQMLPYILTLVVLLFARKKSSAPAASGKHYYQKGE